jgi:hypothetical protein
VQLNTNANDINNFFTDLGPNTVKNVIGNDNSREFKQHTVYSFVLEQTSIDEVINGCIALKAKMSCDTDGMSTKYYTCD